jgi:hypothetical protein
MIPRTLILAVLMLAESTEMRAHDDPLSSVRSWRT